MEDSPSNCRIKAETNKRLKQVLKTSNLSRETFIDYLLTEAMDQIEAEEVTYEPLPHILIVRRELKKPAGETLLSRMKSMLLFMQSPALRAAEEPPTKKKSPYAS